MIKVSFIVPVYNVEPYLANCIESLLRQTDREIEIILVNDGSIDGSGSICDTYAERNVQVQAFHQENRGVSAARNLGMQQAAGEWICFIDSDDWVRSDFVELCMRFVKVDTEICFFQHQETKSVSAQEQLEVLDVSYFDQEDFSLFMHAAFNRDMKCQYDFHKVKLSTVCKLYRASFVRKWNASFLVGLATGEDLLFNLGLYQHASFGCYIPYELYHHRVWGGSVSKNYSKRALEDYLKLMRALEVVVEHMPDPAAYRDDLDAKAAVSIGFAVMLCFCNYRNQDTYANRKRACFQYMKEPEYADRIGRVTVRQFRPVKAVLIYLIKKRLFFLVDILCRLKTRK